MLKHKRIIIDSFAILGLIILILDTRTAITGAQEGIRLCLYSVIPTLFPFCVLSKLFNTSFLGKRIPVLLPLTRICGIPDGAESILLSGFLGGYPVGAQAINDAYQQGALTLSDARRLLGFCSNAGPAFIFGMLGCLFESKRAAWWLLYIHILSSLSVGILLPGKSKSKCSMIQEQPPKLTKIIEESIKSMALVSAWIILFRMILTFCQRWFMWLFPKGIQIGVSGMLELANGCLSLSTIEEEGLRFILAAAFIGFGGICVTMQTISVTKDIGPSLYFPGKILQAGFSVLFASFVQNLIFPVVSHRKIPLYLPVTCCGIIAGLLIFLHRKKKVVAFAA